MSQNSPASSLMGATNFASASTLQDLLKSTNIEQDVILLEQLKELLKPGCLSSSQSDDDCEREWLEKGIDDDPFPGAQLGKLFGSQTEFEQFTFYIFERRYGRTKFLINSTFDDNLEGLDDGLDPLVTSPRGQEDGRLLVKLNTLLDEQLRW